MLRSQIVAICVRDQGSGHESRAAIADKSNIDIMQTISGSGL
jgi:hypothetical protein